MKDQRLSATDTGGGGTGAQGGELVQDTVASLEKEKKKATGLETRFLPFRSPRTLPP